MTDAGVRDGARQVVVAGSAVFMVGATAIGAVGINEAVNTERRSPVEPAGYAFTIWGVIFLLALISAAFQARPSQRANPLQRAVGWWTAGAYVCTGMWSVAVPSGGFDVAQAVLFGAALCLAVAFARIASLSVRRPATIAERWWVILPVAPFLGWLTAANAVSFHGRLVAWGSMAEGSTAGQIVGAALIVGGGLVAAAFVRIARPVLLPLGIAFAATLLWACVGIVVNQLSFAPLVVGAAVVAAGMVVGTLAVEWFSLSGGSSGGWPRLLERS